MSRESEHTCHIPYCKTHCRPEWLMCYPHWKKVSRPLQRAVWLHYRDGQCNLTPPPSPAWHEAAKAAIVYVVKLEKT